MKEGCPAITDDWCTSSVHNINRYVNYDLEGLVKRSIRQPLWLL